MYVQMGTATGRSSSYCLLCGIISCCPVTEKPYRLKKEKKDCAKRCSSTLSTNAFAMVWD